MECSEVHALRPYPLYRESGVPWLEEVPAHWEVRPLKRIGSFSSGAGFPIAAQGSIGEEILFVKVSDMNRLGNNAEIVGAASTVSRETALNLGAQIFETDTIIFPKVGGALLTNKRRMLVRPTCIDNNLMACIVTDANVPFVFRLLNWLDLARMSKPGPVPAISEGEVREIRVALPSLPEQAAIVRFLDHADRRIQRYIRAKQKLIALLEEQKQATIHQAVTGRIDVRTGQPYPAYKPSGVEWLGEVPEQWDVVALKRVSLDRCDGPFGSGLKSSHYTDGGMRVIRLQNIGHGEFDDSDAAYISASHYATLGDHSVEAGDVLIAGLGDSNHPAGRACVAPACVTPAMVKADCFRFRLNANLADPEFVSLQMTATADTASAILSTGATRKRTNLQTTSARLTAIPSPREQYAIVEYARVRISRAKGAQQAVEREIALLAEYRTRLIADVVTGKLDVREAAAVLPEEPGDADGTEAGCAEAEGGSDGRSDHNWRTEVPATQPEMTP